MYTNSFRVAVDCSSGPNRIGPSAQMSLRAPRSLRLVVVLGWRPKSHAATKGSERQFKHPTKRGRVTVPHSNKDIPRGTVVSIYRQAGWRSGGA